jgi:DMSO/TMAO reductase YedYZ heme-binding membrane subunit
VVILMCSYLSVLHSFIYLFCILFGVNFSEVDTSLTNRSNLSCG